MKLASAAVGLVAVTMGKEIVTVDGRKAREGERVGLGLNDDFCLF